MVSSIGVTSATQAIQPTRINTEQEQAAAAPTPEVAQDAPVATQSAESAAADRLGNQLGADLDTARVRRAVEESGAATSSAATEETDTTEAPAQAGAPPTSGGAGGAASSASSSTETDYIAEADTNSDKTVSDEERAVYGAKLREQAKEQAAQAEQFVDQTASVRAA